LDCEIIKKRVFAQFLFLDEKDWKKPPSRPHQEMYASTFPFVHSLQVGYFLQVHVPCPPPRKPCAVLIRAADRYGTATAETATLRRKNASVPGTPAETPILITGDFHLPNSEQTTARKTIINGQGGATTNNQNSLTAGQHGLVLIRDV
jgi:hypothetical protein